MYYNHNRFWHFYFLRLADKNLLTTKVEDRLETPLGSPPLWSCLRINENDLEFF